jgi:hypothetical protein
VLIITGWNEAKHIASPSGTPQLQQLRISYISTWRQYISMSGNLIQWDSVKGHYAYAIEIHWPKCPYYATNERVSHEHEVKVAGCTPLWAKKRLLSSLIATNYDRSHSECKQGKNKMQLTYECKWGFIYMYYLHIRTTFNIRTRGN